MRRILSLRTALILAVVLGLLTGYRIVVVQRINLTIPDEKTFREVLSGKDHVLIKKLEFVEGIGQETFFEMDGEELITEMLELIHFEEPIVPRLKFWQIFREPSTVRCKCIWDRILTFSGPDNETVTFEFLCGVCLRWEEGPWESDIGLVDSKKDALYEFIDIHSVEIY